MKLFSRELNWLYVAKSFKNGPIDLEEDLPAREMFYPLTIFITLFFWMTCTAYNLCYCKAMKKEKLKVTCY